ncbi:hypothetical protein L3Q82_008018 [Xyrichtys novacula]|uniref:Uncharacterized protein n=1 Tax=Xyrichtys novacula TaxID=13765 RepID=A0AAV1FHS2_XYRNO|nr:hypothetical protein L3Q82_008018 [Xyrichtys novacula]
MDERCSLHGGPGARDSDRTSHRGTPPAIVDVLSAGARENGTLKSRIHCAPFFPRRMPGVTVVSNRRQAPFIE